MATQAVDFSDLGGKRVDADEAEATPSKPEGGPTARFLTILFMGIC
jgi:hypothetical protein